MTPEFSRPDLASAADPRFDLKCFRLLVAKEWRHLLFSPKFVAASLVVTVACF